MLSGIHTGLVSGQPAQMLAMGEEGEFSGDLISSWQSFERLALLIATIGHWPM